MTKQTNLTHLAEMLQASKPIKRESGTNFEKGMWGTLLTELAVFVNRYMFLYFMEIADESVPLLIIEARRFYHRPWKTVNRVSNMFVTTGNVPDWRGIEFGPESGHIDVIV